jgi:hypothetical protein
MSQRCQKATALLLQRSASPMRRSVVVFVGNNEDPHIAVYKTHQQSWEISFVTPKRLCNNICQQLV